MHSFHYIARHIGNTRIEQYYNLREGSYQPRRFTSAQDFVGSRPKIRQCTLSGNWCRQWNVDQVQMEDHISNQEAKRQGMCSSSCSFHTQPLYFNHEPPPSNILPFNPKTTSWFPFNYGTGSEQHYHESLGLNFCKCLGVKPCSNYSNW